jgi:hypothetical protein
MNTKIIYLMTLGAFMLIGLQAAQAAMPQLSQGDACRRDCTTSCQNKPINQMPEKCKGSYLNCLAECPQ